MTWVNAVLLYIIVVQAVVGFFMTRDERQEGED